MEESDNSSVDQRSTQVRIFIIVSNELRSLKRTEALQKAITEIKHRAGVIMDLTPFEIDQNEVKDKLQETPYEGQDDTSRQNTQKVEKISRINEDLDIKLKNESGTGYSDRLFT